MPYSMKVWNEALTGCTQDGLAVLRDRLELQAGRDFDASVALFVRLCTTRVEVHYTRVLKGPWKVLFWSTNPARSRYVRVWVERDWNRIVNKYVYVFVDKLTGDILRPQSDLSPSGVLGNVFDPDPSTCCDFTGPLYRGHKIGLVL